MRKNYNKQLLLSETTQAHPKVMELERISTILSDNANIYELVARDLVPSMNNAGANGMRTDSPCCHHKTN